MVRNTFEVQNVGDLLREKRKQLGKDLKEVSEQTKIRIEYLLALESGKYDLFASDVYAKGFLKKYAKYLGISPERASAMYRRESLKQGKSNLQTTNFLQQQLNRPKFEFSSGRLIALAIGVILLAVLIYIGSQISTVLKSPELSLTVPVSATAGQEVSYTTALDKISLRGRVELGSSLKLNGNPVDVNNLQNFEIKDLSLSLGENQLLLKAENQFGQQSTLNLTVIRDTAATTTSPSPGTNPTASPSVAGVVTTPGQTELKAELEIVNRETYVQVKIDGQTTFAQVLKVGQIKDFLSSSSISISSPRPDSVKLTINDVNYPLTNSRPYEFTLDSTGQVQMLNT